MKWPAFFRSVRHRMFVSYLLILTLPLLILGVGGYRSVVRSISQQTGLAYRDMLHQINYSVEQRFREMDQLAVTLANTQWVQKITYMDGPAIDYKRIDPIEINRCIYEMNNYQALNDFADRMALIFNTKNTVLSSTGLDSLEWYFANDYRSQGLDVTDWLKLIGVYHKGTVINTMSLTSYTKTYQGITFIKTLPMIDQTPRATLLVSIRESTVKALLLAGSKSQGLSVYVFDRDGSPVTGINIQDASLQHLADQLLQDPDFQWNGITDQNQNMLFSMKSEMNGWTYVAAVPTRLIFSEAKLIRTISLILAVLSISAGILLAYSFTRQNYRPVKRLLSMAVTGDRKSAGDSRQTQTDEFGMLERAFQSMVDNQSQLQERIESYRPLAMHSFFLKLLYDMLTTEEAEIARQIVDMENKADAWTVAVMIIGSTEAGSDLVRQKVVQWSIADSQPVYLVEIDNTRLAFLLNDHRRERITELVRSILQTLLSNTPHEGVRIGVGSTYSDLELISLSFKEAMMALNDAIFRGVEGHDLVFYADVQSAQQLVFSFPHEKEEELANRVRQGQYELVEQLLDDMLQIHAELPPWPFLTMQFAFYHLLSIAIRIMGETDLIMPDLINERDFLQLDTVTAMKACVLKVYKQICQEMSHKREGKWLKQRQDIFDYLDEHACDNNLSLEMVADHFRMAVPYLSKFIKSQSGLNFTDYLTKKRISKARELMVSTTLSLEEISKTIGYTATLTFRRAFKRVEGVNPQEYRNMIDN